MDEEIVKLNGKFTFIKYRNEENYYTIASFRINDELEKTITVVGYFADIQMDILYNIFGIYTENPRYGLQFEIQNYELPLPDEKDSVVRFLSGTHFPGIGKKTATLIVETLGRTCLQRIKEDYTVLETVIGLSDKNIQSIKQGLEELDSGLEELIQFFNINGIGIRNLIRLNRTYGKDALRLLKENPYRVIEECDGFGFKTADKIGQYIGIDAKDSRRLVALLISLTMEMCMSSGDSYVLKQRLQQRFYEESDEASDFDSLLEECILRKQLVLENERVYPISQFDAESYIANYLSNFPMQHLDPIDMHYLHQSLDDLQKESGIHYDETQIHAIQSFFEHDFMIITGGPGTGKTTIVKALVHLVKNLYPFSVLSLLAPTGRAAKRLAELTEHDATTIHSFLRWDLESNTFGANQDNPILSDILIIDEFSMVDQWVFYNLVKASSGVKKICIIGDEDQLPSVGPGAVFRDLMEVNFYPVIRLETIYRQEEGSGVISLAKDIRDGLLQPNYSQDVSFIETKRADIKNHIQTIVNYALDKGYELNDIQVLSPKYSGVAGIDLLNSALQEKFNPADKHKKEIKVGYTILREGDKILQLKNQPDDDVYNGDIGTLIEILPAKESGVGKTILIVDFQGIFVEYTQENWNNITLAYCISIHKSQGSEYPIVIMPITHQMTGMLQRKLLYTGVTRAKQSLIILGELKAFYRGIEILETHSRQTTLKEKISLRMWR